MKKSIDSKEVKEKIDQITTVLKLLKQTNSEDFNCTIRLRTIMREEMKLLLNCDKDEMVTMDFDTLYYLLIHVNGQYTLLSKPYQTL
jgi:hypothetical protein